MLPIWSTKKHKITHREDVSIQQFPVEVDRLVLVVVIVVDMERLGLVSVIVQ